jgi:Raf kinase inhibitor-like YbhB/YbcL family protein
MYVFNVMRTTSTIITIVIVVVLAALIFRIANKASTKAVTQSPSPTVSVTPTPTPEPEFALLSSAFGNGDTIPLEYTCEGANTLPPLSWKDAPTSTQSFAITMYDPDVPKQVRPQGFFDHWVIFNIPATTTSINASSTVGILGNNGGAKASYTGPCPPTNYEPKEHRYLFTLYALDNLLGLKRGATRAEIEKAVVGHTLASTTLMGRYQKTK